MDKKIYASVLAVASLAGIYAFYTSLNTPKIAKAAAVVDTQLVEQIDSTLNLSTANLLDDTEEQEEINNEDIFERMASQTNTINKISKVYGIENLSTNYTVHENVVRKNEFLSDILNDCNLSTMEIDDADKSSKKVFRQTKFKSDKPYFVLCDSENKAQCFIYESSPIDYVVIDFREGKAISYNCQKEVETRLQTASGEIRGSLAGTLARNGLNTNLATALSKSFAWSIDFFKIKEGDKFKAIYEQQYIDGVPVGQGELKAAYMQHRGEDFYTFAYEQDKKTDYFDEKGRSVRKGFLKAPLKFTRISSRYSLNRFHPVLHQNRAHLGTDYAAPKGTPIMSVGDGIVLNAEYGRGNGNFVKIKHDGTYTTQYLHMSRFAKGMRKGIRVKQGQVIGYVGSTGLATGPHLCYRLWKRGAQVDPTREKSITYMTKTVNRKNAADYKKYVNEMTTALNALEYPIQQEDLNPNEYEEVAEK